MRSYKLHMAIVAIACIALQEVDCARTKGVASRTPTAVASPTYEETSLSGSRMAGQHHDCTNYKSEIWNKAFQNPNAMHLMKLTFDAATVMGKNEVCSDTVRSVIYFIKMMTTNENVHKMVGMFMKMSKTAVKLAMGARSSKWGDESDEFQDNGLPTESELNGDNRTLKDLVLRVIDSPKLTELVANSFNRIVPWLVDPVTRNRLFKLIGSIDTLTKPSQNEVRIKNTIKKLTNALPASVTKSAVSIPATLAMGALKRFKIAK